jgi:hypothetical protein
VLARLIISERAAGDESRAQVQRPGWTEGCRGPGLQAYPAATLIARHVDQVDHHRSPDATTACIDLSSA